MRVIEYEQLPERQELRMEVVNEFVKRHEYWEYAAKGKNWIAEITGLSKIYGFKRRFLDLVLRGREKHFLLKDFVPGHLYEIVSTSVSRGRSYPRIQSIFECVYIGDKEILLREVFESEVLEQFSDYSLSVPRILAEHLLSNVSREEAIRLIKEIS
jgi:hypothetical protein